MESSENERWPSQIGPRSLDASALLLDSLQDYAFITFDPDNRIAFWSAGAAHLLGWDKAEILGQLGVVLFTPEDRDRGEVDKELATARTKGRAEDERWHLRKNGTRFWASGVMTPLRDEGGGLLGYAKVMRDLTERKPTEERLRQSEERLRLIIENVRDHAIFQVDLAGNIIGWNPAAERLFGYLESEILGKPVRTLSAQGDQQERYPEWELGQTLARGDFEDERWMVRRDGTQFYAQWVTHLMRDGNGQVRGFVKVLRDETAKKKAQVEAERRQRRERERLERSVQATGQELDRTKEELRALAGQLMVAQEEERRHMARELHDHLAQRLAVVQMELVSFGQQLPDGGGQLTIRVDQMVQEMAALAGEVRTMSHRLHPSTLEQLGLDVALRQLVEEFERVYGLALHLRAEPLSRPVALPTATVLYRIAQEALRNVAKHAPDARVIVTLSGDNGELHLTIQDDGPGFDPAAVRANGGLGLVSMEERAHLAGGVVMFGRAQGQGMEVRVSVPWPEAEA